MDISTFGSLESSFNWAFVIPAYSEPKIEITLDSIKEIFDFCSDGLIVIVINASALSDNSVLKQNELTKNLIHTWCKKYDQINLHLIIEEQMPTKFAGVGLARKIGMDYVVSLLNPKAWIFSADADSIYRINKTQFLNLLTSNSETALFSFEHPIPDPNHPIIEYELFLRYYYQALKWCNYPFYYYTVGSAFGVKKEIYSKSGGMNKKKAGEDFYFLHKVFPHTKVVESQAIRVIPSSRISNRVPFGTGKAVLNAKSSCFNLRYTYDLKSFRDWKIFQDYLNCSDYINPDDFGQLPHSVLDFLKIINFKEELQNIENSTSNSNSYKKRIIHFIDGFKIMKYLHFARDYYYTNISIKNASIDLWNIMFKQKLSISNSEDLLKLYREIEKN